MSIVVFIFQIIFGLLVLAWLSTSIVIVRQKTAVVLERFGKFVGVLQSGIHLKRPWPITSASPGISLRIQQIKENVDVKTADNLFVQFPVAIQYFVTPQHVEKAHYELDDPVEQIRTYVFNTVRSECAKMQFDALYAERTKIEDAVTETLKENIEGFGFTIRNVLVDEPRVEADVRHAIQAEKVAERERAAAVHLAEAERIRVVAEAEAQSESKVLQGKGIAGMRKEVANGFAESVKSLGDASDGKVAVEHLMHLLLRVQELDTQHSIAQSMGEKGIVIMGSGADNNTGTNQIANFTAALNATKEHEK